MDSISELDDAQNFALLDTTIYTQADHDLALRYAPRIRFDIREPFYPSVVGYTVFRQDGLSPSFPREVKLPAGSAFAIEYAIWWDWDIGHLYELEHIWVYVDQNGSMIDAEASWHGDYNRMVVDGEQLPVEDQRLVIYSEPGKHAFAPSPDWYLERQRQNVASCGRYAGAMGVHVTPLFEGIIRDRTPLNNRLVHTYLERRAFDPTYEFGSRFELETAVFVPWQSLFEWIPVRVNWWTQKLQQLIPPNERRVLRIAHRGASAYAQENSAASIQKAAELGSDMVEVDIRVTADDVPVISHDSSLKRIYDIDGLISDFTLDELLKLETAHGRVMTFEEMVKLCRSLHLGIYLDIKEIDPKAAMSLFGILDSYGFWKYTIFGSFRPDYLADIKAARPQAVTSILFGAVHIDPVMLAQSIQANFVHPCWESQSEQPHTLLTPEWIARVREADLGIVCWHEERPSEIAALKALGVDAICSDKPELLLDSSESTSV